LLHLDLVDLLLVAGISLVTYVGCVALCLRTRWPASEVLLAAFVCNIAQIVLTQTALGLVNQLNPLNLIIVVGTTMLGLFIVICTLGNRRLDALTWPERRAELSSAWREICGCKSCVLLIGLVGAWSVWTLFLGLIFPPSSFDEFYYHMPIVASIIQSQSVLPPPSVWPWISAYPRNAELLAVWSSIFLHRDTLADLALLPQLWAGALAPFVAARRIGASRSWSILCGCLFAFAPIVLMEAKATYVDLMVGCFWSVGVAFVTPTSSKSTARGPSTHALAILTGLAAGLILGTKITGLVIAGGLLCLFVVRLAQSRTSLRSGVLQVGLVVSLMCVVGSLWYVLAFKTFGNPVYPIPIRLGKLVILPGNDAFLLPLYAATAREVAHVSQGIDRWVAAWFERQPQTNMSGQWAGLGPLWPVLGLPAVLVWGGARKRAAQCLAARAHRGSRVVFGCAPI